MDNLSMNGLWIKPKLLHKTITTAYSLDDTKDFKSMSVSLSAFIHLIGNAIVDRLHIICTFALL